MIKTFKHAGLEKFYLEGSNTGIQPQHQHCLQVALSRLNAAHSPQDMQLPGFNVQQLAGDLKEHYALDIPQNWRIIFKFEGHDVTDLNYINLPKQTHQPQ